jgi:hypothetical protein
MRLEVYRICYQWDSAKLVMEDEILWIYAGLGG